MTLDQFVAKRVRLNAAFALKVTISVNSLSFLLKYRPEEYSLAVAALLSGMLTLVGDSE